MAGLYMLLRTTAGSPLLLGSPTREVRKMLWRDRGRLVNAKNTTSAELPRRPHDASCSSHWGRFLEFPLPPSFDGLPCDAFMFTGCFLKFDSAPFPPAPRYKLAPHNLACVIAEDFVQDAFWFSGCPYHGLPLWIRWQDHSGKWCTENGNAPPQATLHLRGRLNVCYALDCALRWAGGIN